MAFISLLTTTWRHNYKKFHSHMICVFVSVYFSILYWCTFISVALHGLWWSEGRRWLCLCPSLWNLLWNIEKQSFSPFLTDHCNFSPPLSGQEEQVLGKVIKSIITYHICADCIEAIAFLVIKFYSWEFVISSSSGERPIHFQSLVEQALINYEKLHTIKNPIALPHCKNIGDY